LVWFVRLPLIELDLPLSVVNTRLNRFEILGESPRGSCLPRIARWVRAIVPSLTKRGRAAALAASAKQSGKLHLGSGSHICEGWTNVDLNPAPGSFVWNLTEPLPVASGSIRYIFTEHFIEHLTRAHSLALLTECRRVLGENGVLRVSTPNLRFLVDQYLKSRVEEWRDVGWTPATPCAMLNEGLRLWGHKFIYDEPELILLLREAGFTRIGAATWHESPHEPLRGLEARPFHRELIWEAQS
jgi:predicted SAM-dependent methyltransferase